jgi:hypothetical protein
LKKKESCDSIRSDIRALFKFSVVSRRAPCSAEIRLTWVGLRYHPCDRVADGYRLIIRASSWRKVVPENLLGTDSFIRNRATTQEKKVMIITSACAVTEWRKQLKDVKNWVDAEKQFFFVNSRTVQRGWWRAMYAEEVIAITGWREWNKCVGANGVTCEQ